MDKMNSVIDLASLEAIAALQQAGGDDLLKSVIEMYLSHSLTLMQKLEDAVAADDQQSIMEAAHTLKSSSAQLGARHLAKLLQEMEIMGKNRQTTGAPQHMNSLREEYQTARTALEEYLRSKSA